MSTHSDTYAQALALLFSNYIRFFGTRKGKGNKGWVEGRGGRGGQSLQQPRVFTVSHGEDGWREMEYPTEHGSW